MVGQGSSQCTTTRRYSFLSRVGHGWGPPAREDRDYFWPHSRAAIRQIGLNERHANARRLFRWILARKKDEIALQDARRDALGQSLDADQTQDLLAKMEKAGWLRMKTSRTTGRSKHRWDVNPKFFTFMNAQSAENAESV